MNRWSICIILGLIFLASTAGRAQVDLSCSRIAIISIDTQDAAINADHRITATMSVFDGASDFNCITDIPADVGAISIAWRGHSSLDFDKKQYKLETQTPAGENRNVSLLGLPAENDWILSAPYADKSLIRNELAYSLARDMGRYAARGRPCELLLNGEYMGLFWLREKIKRDANRVDIATLTPSDISGDELTGGYMVKIDALDDEYCGWGLASDNIYIQPEYPKCEELEPEQHSYIIYATQELDASITQQNQDLWAKVDLASAVDYFLVNELAKNVDAYLKSTYIYKTKDSNGGLFHFGPVWDFNLAFGNADYSEAYITSGFNAESHLWWSHILSDTTFIDAAKSRWAALREEGNIMHPQSLIDRVDSLSNTLGDASSRNFMRWDILGQYVWPNYYYHGLEYDDELDYVKYWLEHRLHWMDNALDVQPGPFIKGPADEVVLFPNPFSDFLNLKISLPHNGHLRLEFINNLGQPLRVEEYGYMEQGPQFLVLQGDWIDIAKGPLMVKVFVDEHMLHSQVLIKKR